MGNLNWGIDTIVTGLVGLALWLIKGKVTNIEATIEQNRKRIKSDDEILQLVNGKYFSRREVDQIIKERDEWRENIKEDLAKIEAEIMRLRDKDQVITIKVFDSISLILNQISGLLNKHK